MEENELWYVWSWVVTSIPNGYIIESITVPQVPLPWYTKRWLWFLRWHAFQEVALLFLQWCCQSQQKRSGFCPPPLWYAQIGRSNLLCVFQSAQLYLQGGIQKLSVSERKTNKYTVNTHTHTHKQQCFTWNYNIGQVEIFFGDSYNVYCCVLCWQLRSLKWLAINGMVKCNIIHAHAKLINYANMQTSMTS